MGGIGQAVSGVFGDAVSTVVSPVLGIATALVKKKGTYTQNDTVAPTVNTAVKSVAGANEEIARKRTAQRRIAGVTNTVLSDADTLG